MPAARVWALVKVNSTSERHSSGCAAASSTATIVPSFGPITAAPSDRAGLQHGDGVAYLRLEVGELVQRYRVGESGASAVEVDQPTRRA
jgi:hypothetical protein